MQIRKILIILSLFSLQYLFALNTEQSLKNFIDDVTSVIPERTVISVGNFPLVPGDLASPFSVYIQEKIKQDIVQSNFLLSERKDINALIEEIKLGLSGILDENSAAKAGELLGVKYIMSGSYRITDQNIVLNIQLISVESGIHELQKEYVISKGELPSGVAYFPDNYQDAQFVIEELSTIADKNDNILDFRIWTTRGNGGVYKDGEKLEILFFSNRDCYVKIYHIDVNKKVSLIFPNEYYSGNLLSGGMIHRIPDSSYPFSFVLGAPYGVEFIKVLISNTPFPQSEESFSELGNASANMMTRGLSLEQKKTLSAERLISYYIGE